LSSSISWQLSTFIKYEILFCVTYTNVWSTIGVYNKCALVYFREYSHFKLTTPSPLHLDPINVVSHFIISLKYEWILISMLAQVLRDIFAILHVILLISSLHHKTKCSEKTISVSQNLFQVKAFLSDFGTHLLYVICVLAPWLLLLIIGIISNGRFVLWFCKLILFDVVLFLISFICSHYII